MNRVIRANFYKTCSGIVMVELAIILPLLLFLLFGITELGRALSQQNQLTQAVELGGRYIARVEGIVDVDNNCSKVGVGDDEDWFNAEAEAKNLIEFGCGSDDVSEGCDDAILPNITFDVLSFVVESRTSSSVTVSACVITVRATAPFQSIFGAAPGDDLVSVPGFSLGGVTLNASTQERYIGR